MVVALIALMVATAGTGYAAGVLPGNSVGSKQIKRGSVTNAKLQNGAVDSAKVKDGSLRKVDFVATDLPAGPAGPKGDKGDPGAPGTNGTNGTNGTAGAAGATNVTTRSVSASEPVGESELTVPCNAGEKAVGGGGLIPLLDPEVTFMGTYPSPSTNATTPTGWTARFKITGIAHTVTTWAVCAAP
jgi:hypothetical protein